MEGNKFRYGWKKSDMVGKLLRIQGGNDWKYSHMVGKSLTWSENYSGWKATNSNMVGNFPQGVRKGVLSHRTFSLVHPSYRREFPVPFSISVVYNCWLCVSKCPADRLKINFPVLLSVDPPFCFPIFCTNFYYINSISGSEVWNLDLWRKIAQCYVMRR